MRKIKPNGTKNSIISVRNQMKYKDVITGFENDKSLKEVNDDGLKDLDDISEDE